MKFWQSLSAPERTVALAIMLVPVIWAIPGLDLFGTLLLMAVVAHDLWHHGHLRFGRPRPEVLALLAFSLYAAANAALHAPTLTPRLLLAPLLLWGSGGLLLWYVQANRVRVRTPVLAGALGASALQMLALFAAVHFGLGEPPYRPPNPLFASLFVRIQPFYPGTANPNYLQPYIPEDTIAPGFARWSFFWGYPEVLALVAGAIVLVAWDLRDRRWALALGVAGIALGILSGTRSLWLVLPLIVVGRLAVALGRVGGRALVLALVAASGFAALSLPPLTEALASRLGETVSATSGYRRDSTEVRQRIYVRTWQHLAEAWPTGHGLPGRTVLPGYAYAGLGTHSFWLGLLYQGGAVGTALFAAFAGGFGWWLVRTRHDRPLAAFGVLLMVGLLLAVMEFEIVKMLLVLLCAMLQRQTPPTPSRG